MRCASVSSGLSPRSGSLCETTRPRFRSMTRTAWQQGQTTSSSDFRRDMSGSPFELVEAADPELFLDLDRLAVRQLRDQPQIVNLHASEREPLSEAGDEGVERRLEASLRRNRARRDAIVRVQPDLDVLPFFRRLIVHGQ